MTYYGQFDPPTDKIIEEYFDPSKWGIAIEVGAAHGIAASNTLHFEQIGWKCLCIEPNPNLFLQLQRSRRYVLNWAISDFHADNIDFNVCTLGESEETAISALRIDQELFNMHNVSKVYTIKVSVRTLDECIQSFFTPIDFISIDTEGTELDVLKGLSINRYKPKLLVVENNFNNPNIEEYLKPFGYMKVRRHVINDFYMVPQ